MKQVVFVSGKGGTGKSTVVASLNILVGDKMLADCDVDAPNLHLLLGGKRLEENDFFGADRAAIDPALCVRCGLCREACRFEAVDERFQVDGMRCEGCGACLLACPRGAITLSEVKTGETYLDDTSGGTFSHALLDVGAEGSGKLVTEVKRNLEASRKGEAWALVDGSPGIGCVVIASISGADAVVAVCEPTQSGRSDLERVLAVARHFGIPAFVCVNKYDLNPEVTDGIRRFCEDNRFPLIGQIPFDPQVMRSLQAFKTPVDAGLRNVSDEIMNIWNNLVRQLNGFDGDRTEGRR